MKPIEAAKEAVTVEDLAEKLSGAPGVKRGREVFFRCVLHDDTNPSLRVDPEQGVWYCDPCSVGGDVVRLAQLAWEHTDNGRGAAEAAAYLLMEFGHEVPQRPPSWSAKQKRQAKMREDLEGAKRRHVQRRLYRLFAPHIEGIENPLERQAEKAAVWNDLGDLAHQIIERRWSV